MPTVRKPAPGVSRRVVRTALAGTFLLATGAFVLSFASLSNLAVMAGIDRHLAWIWPLIVDGLIVVSTVAIVALAEHGRRALVYPWFLLIAGAFVSTVANSVHAILVADGAVPRAVSALIAAVPPLVLLAITHLSVDLVQRSAQPVKRAARAARKQTEQAAQPVTFLPADGADDEQDAQVEAAA